MVSSFRCLSVGAISMLLAACGGGGGGQSNLNNPPPVVNQLPVANAGADQTVAAGALVSLSGGGTDSDGSISGFSWVQSAGPTVTLNNPRTASPSFTAPSASSNSTLRFTLTVTDNQNATASDEVVVNVGSTAATPPVVVSGRVSYDRIRFKAQQDAGLDMNNPVVAAARGITVQALGSSNTVIASTTTDGSGNYSLSVPGNSSVTLRARAETKRTTAPLWDVGVVDNTNGNALYVLDSVISNTGSAASTRDLHAASGWTGSAYTATRAAAPFAILDKIYDALQKTVAVDASASFPRLTVNWSVNNVPADGDITEGRIGTSFYSNGQLYILGQANVDTDEFDDHVIVHEWGHYFEDTLSASDSIGGPHGGDELLDLRLAFGEGFGNALSGIVTDDPAYRDSIGSNQASDFTINVEANPTAADNSGWYSESSVQSILYDLYDPAADGSDSLALGFGPIYRVLVDAQKTTPLRTSIFSFVTALKAANPSMESEINAIVSAQRINSAAIDNAGSQETNDAGVGSDVLPVYTAISVNGPAQVVCSINTFGEPNKLSNARFLSFTLAAAANLSVQVTGGVDPDIVLHRRGQASRVAESNAMGSETLAASNQAAGTYVIETYEFRNTDNDSSSGGRTCLNVSVTSN